MITAILAGVVLRAVDLGGYSSEDREVVIMESALQLDRIIGLTTLSNASFSSPAVGKRNTSSIAGDTFYTAGNVVVRYNSEENKQRGFYQLTDCSADSKSTNSDGNAVSCISVAPDGQYLAVGERALGNRGAAVHIYSVRSYKLLASSTSSTSGGHKFGVGCIGFLPGHSNRYLVSAGFKQDKQLILWDTQSSSEGGKNKLSLTIVGVFKIGNKVHSMSFHSSGLYFITAGDRHLKWWMVNQSPNQDSITLDGKAAGILEVKQLSFNSTSKLV